MLCITAINTSNMITTVLCAILTCAKKTYNLQVVSATSSEVL